MFVETKHLVGKKCRRSFPRQLSLFQLLEICENNNILLKENNNGCSEMNFILKYGYE